MKQDKSVSFSESQINSLIENIKNFQLEFSCTEFGDTKMWQSRTYYATFIKNIEI